MDSSVLLQCYAELSEVLGSVVSHCSTALHLGQQMFDYLEAVADDHNVDAIFRCSVDSSATREAALAIDIVKERRKCGICVQM